MNTSKLKITRHFVSIFATVLTAGFLSLWTIYVDEEYGLAVFVFTPIFLGISATVIRGYGNNATWMDCWHSSYWSLITYAASFIVFAYEGLICVIMMLPIALLFTWIGAAVAFSMLTRFREKSPLLLVLSFLAVPITSFTEKDIKPETISVTTQIIINATPKEVWDIVVAFPELEAPNELLFRAGIAYPINATIDGQGVGAIRNCNFSTGSFVEPITVWDEPALLAFDVEQQPATMKELSFWDVDSPHLHDYFSSEKGQFKLTQLANGKTLLEGTTWYKNDIKPAFYWEIWSDYIIHKIHNRVLEHIKTVAEAK